MVEETKLLLTTISRNSSVCLEEISVASTNSTMECGNDKKYMRLGSDFLLFIRSAEMEMGKAMFVLRLFISAVFKNGLSIQPLKTDTSHNSDP